MGISHSCPAQVAWLKSPANAFYHGNWRNYGAPTFDLPGTDALLETAYDLALPAYFGDDDLRHVAEIRRMLAERSDTSVATTALPTPDTVMTGDRAA